MKKVFIISTLALGLFTSCSNNSEKEATPPTETVQPIDAANSAVNSADSIKAAADKMAKDSADAAHGHTH